MSDVRFETIHYFVSSFRHCRKWAAVAGCNWQLVIGQSASACGHCVSPPCKQAADKLSCSKDQASIESLSSFPFPSPSDSPRTAYRRSSHSSTLTDAHHHPRGALARRASVEKKRERIQRGSPGVPKSPTVGSWQVNTLFMLGAVLYSTCELPNQLILATSQYVVFTAHSAIAILRIHLPRWTA